MKKALSITSHLLALVGLVSFGIVFYNLTFKGSTYWIRASYGEAPIELGLVILASVIVLVSIWGQIRN